MPCHLRHARGVTLIELLMTLLVLAVLLSVAAPAFGDLFDSGRMRSARSALTVALSEARSTAVTRHARVIVCPSRDRSTCDPVTRWQSGWMVFVDTDQDGLHDAGEQVVSLSQAQSRGLAILSSRGRRFVAYRPDGSATGSNLTLTFCDRRGVADATALIMNNAGRVRSGTPSAAAAAAACGAVGG